MPSIEAIAIDAAHKQLRAALGTSSEAAARAQLELVVAIVRAKRGAR
jgi:hypothetical protein